MITGIGTDIVEVARIAKAIEKWGDHFLQHVFSQEEIAYCSGHKFPHEHYAGRFAAKEAVIKALPDIKQLQWKNIQITNDDTGKPRCVVVGKNLKHPIHISISHTRHHAIAFAVIAT
ncbi:MAG: holo-ACP synthase [Candidatus Omnitrophica bacterium]|nr:holo-ACP synthase [Candidatus Omnitrophota bacterium]